MNPKETNMIILKIANMGEIKIELDYKNAPISSANFVSLVNKGFYDGLTFHRIIKGFMIQGGCPLGNGTGGPGYSIKGEFRSNGVNNQLSHKRGVISMARAMNPNSAGSQFFICDKDDLFLDGQYAAFGHVIEGMDVVDKIASVKTGYQDKPLNKVVIEKALSVEEPEPEFEKIN
ncbi:MAG: peptidylprolyl isomerase [Bacilli bacterium]|nr:peptidylprolyl isomerase [Bacilli bacterium]